MTKEERSEYNRNYRKKREALSKEYTKLRKQKIQEARERGRKYL